MSQKLPDDEIAENANSLTSKYRKVFNVIHAMAKDYVKYNLHNVEPVYLYLSGKGGAGKSHLVKVIYNAITLLYDCKNLKKT